MRRDVLSKAVAARLDSRSSKARTPPKQLQQLFTLYSEASEIFHQSALSKSFHAMLRTKNRPRITRVVSLGLGSLGASKDQARRMKQLVILMAIASHLRSSPTDRDEISLYAQDPTFTKTDEDFLQSLGIQILKTSSPSDLGEAGRMIHEETLLYSPFLTIDAYRQLFASVTTGSGSGAVAPMLIGDDFNALKMKWEKRTEEHRDVDAMIKAMKARNYQRRVVDGEGFWEESDSPFPMALYRVQISERGRRTREKL
ncbi:hypothetical protein B0T10DRAFT_528914 [Thelonectria olida]|uniref:SRR1-like domain-containing protein n=1 Tax=Thelonectria olida TaxID=1576542 RepID=A0A9P8W4I3_9HYPO|nr:hypothetical protein B0T10DRAFT_528914 [Thelonectria olida]